MKRNIYTEIKEIAELKPICDHEEHSFEHFFDLLTEYGIATEEEIILVCQINGTSTQSLLNILYARTALRTFSDLVEDYCELPW